MGNSVSQENQLDIMQNGSGFANNFNDLQNTIQRMVKKSNNSTLTETINLHDSSSDIDFDSIQNIMQNGGLADLLNVRPIRIRYGKVPTFDSAHVGGNQEQVNKLKELESINEKDLEALRNILSKNIGDQTGGCGCSIDSDQNTILSPTSPNPVTKYKSLIGGTKNNMNSDQNTILSPTSPNPVTKYKSLIGGTTNTILSPTSPNPVTEHKSLIGGKKDKKEKSNDKDSDKTEDDDIDSEDEEESEEDIEDEEEDENEDEYDEGADGDELARTKGSSTSSSSSETDEKKKLKRSKKYSDAEYLHTSSHSGGSEEIVIDSKYLYSDNNTFYGSDDNSEYYKAIKNRSIVN